MRHPILNLIVIFATLALAGLARLSFEDALATEMREKELLPLKYDMETRIALKQKGFTVGFGSLRPTIAAFMALSAANDRSDFKWGELEKKFNDIVLIDPKNYYYWDTGSWDLISNASFYYKYNQDISETARSNYFKSYIDKGTLFIERGIKMNPESWKIHRLLARRYSDQYRLPDYARAAEEYTHVITKAERSPKVSANQLRYLHRLRLYSLNKASEKHQQAYDYALQLYHKSPLYHYPGVLLSVWVGQNHPLNKVTTPLSLEEIFTTKDLRGNSISSQDAALNAYKSLKRRYRRPHKLQAQYGVEEGLRAIENKLHIPSHKRIAPAKPLFMR